ncbi:MAG: hypothetical protein MUC35_05795 [Candidatus Margulisbacteria bacterium]|jgi:hypothetical protein|nr:hypothetical protein [Candidatus Margulisiibacteriota bacterium]
MKIGLDIDNVLAHTFRDLAGYFNKHMGLPGETDPNEVVRIMREDKLKMVSYWFTTWRKRLLTQAAPVEGAVETLLEWQPLHQLVLITSRLPLFNRQTKEWLNKHGFPYHELHHARELTKFKKARGCELFVEDNLAEAEILADHCRTVLLVDQPWNRRPTAKKNIVRVKDWAEIRAYRPDGSASKR